MIHPSLCRLRTEQDVRRNSNLLPTCRLLLVYLLAWTLLATHLGAHEPPQPAAKASRAAIADVEQLGGRVRRVGDGWEVDFHLRGRALTDDGLARVANLRDVTWLHLGNTKVTSAGLAHLKDLKQLRWLHLERTAVGDEGMEHVAKLPRLEYLNLYQTQITDKTLDALRRSRSLRRLYVWQTKVTEPGIAKLAAAHPALKITGGLDLAKLPSKFPTEAEKPKPKVKLDWVAVTDRTEAPARSENGINCQILFENRSGKPVKLYWIMYGNGGLKLYATLAPGAKREQNSYSRNAWLVTNEQDQPLGYFVVKSDDSHAVIPKLER